MNRLLFGIPLALAVALAGCGSDDGSAASGDAASSSGAGGGGGAGAEDLEMAEADFECILDWTAVRKFRVTNKLGHTDEALAVANSTEGGTYPVGTVIQLIPTEAMVKRRAGFSPTTKDWEMFFLEVSAQGTTIKARGTTDVVNGFGGNCSTCHAKAEAKWDFVCEDTHGCDPIPVTPEQIKEIQDGDPRCSP